MAETKAALAARALQVSLGRARILPHLDLEIPAGRITALVGANGSGKTTILRSLGRILRPESGQVLIAGRDLAAMPTRLVARELAILPQGPDAPAGLTVRELVGYGRHPWQSGLALTSAEDNRAVDLALAMTGLEPLAARPIGTLSGGQRQRVWIAMALAQDTGILLLDEPTTFLDMAHQLEVLNLLTRINRERGATVVMVVHDLNHALRIADHIIAVADGEVVAKGPPALTMTAEVIARVFGITADLLPDPVTGQPVCVPRSILP